jgi:hypothetical protein
MVLSCSSWHEFVNFASEEHCDHFRHFNSSIHPRHEDSVMSFVDVTLNDPGHGVLDTKFPIVEFERIRLDACHCPLESVLLGIRPRVSCASKFNLNVQLIVSLVLPSFQSVAFQLRSGLSIDPANVTELRFMLQNETSCTSSSGLVLSAQEACNEDAYAKNQEVRGRVKSYNSDKTHDSQKLQKLQTCTLEKEDFKCSTFRQPMVTA